MRVERCTYLEASFLRSLYAVCHENIGEAPAAKLLVNAQYPALENLVDTVFIEEIDFVVQLVQKAEDRFELDVVDLRQATLRLLVLGLRLNPVERQAGDLQRKERVN